jgi:hypothetical protein
MVGYQPMVKMRPLVVNEVAVEVAVGEVYGLHVMSWMVMDRFKHVEELAQRVKQAEVQADGLL